MSKKEKEIIEDVIKTAKQLRKKVNVLCKKDCCFCCPFDKIENCKDYIQLSNMKYNEELKQFQ